MDTHPQQNDILYGLDQTQAHPQHNITQHQHENNLDHNRHRQHRHHRQVCSSELVVATNNDGAQITNANAVIAEPH
jgi:hypothetical protein